MLKSFVKNWWMLVLRGVLAIILGILAIASPGVVAATLILWLGIYMLIDGIINFFSSIINWGKNEDKWLMLFEALISIVLGILILRAPGVTEIVIVIYLAVWAIFSGISKIAIAIQLRKEIEGEGWLIFAGILSVLFGLILIYNPLIGLAAIMLMLAVFLIMIGLMLVVLGFKVKKLKGKAEDIVKEIKS